MAALLPLAVARAQGVPSRIRFIQGYSLGTGHDRYARAFALAAAQGPAQTRITVDSMSRANGRLAARALMDAAPDGATIGGFQTALVLAQLLGDDGVAYDVSRFGWLGAFALEPRVLVASAKLGFADFEDLRRSTGPLAVGAETLASISAREPLILNALLGTRLRPVAGYSSPARGLALATGEIAAATATFDVVQPLIESGEVRALLRLDSHAPPPELDGLPTLRDVAPPATDPVVLGFLDAFSRLGRWVCMPPGAAPEPLAEMRDFFSRTVASGGFRRAVRDAGLPAPARALKGEEVADAVQEIFGRADQSVGAVRAAIACGERIAETGTRGC